jgi:phytoene/squalene synthetase
MFTVKNNDTGEVTQRDSLPAHIPLTSAPAAVIIAAANALGDPDRVKSEADIPKVLTETLEQAQQQKEAAPKAEPEHPKTKLIEATSQRFYMEAIARYGTGQIDDLSDDELRDLVCVIPKKVVPYEKWKEMRGLS